MHKDALECLKYFYAVPKEAIAENKVFIAEAKDFIKKWNKYAVIAKRAIAPRSTEGNIEQLDELLSRLPENERVEIIQQNNDVIAQDKELFEAMLREERKMTESYNSSGTGCSVLILIGIGASLLLMAMI